MSMLNRKKKKKPENTENKDVMPMKNKKKGMMMNLQCLLLFLFRIFKIQLLQHFLPFI